MLEHNPDTVKIVLKNLPLVSIHKFAEKAALAALAAGLQGRFWQFHDELFDSPELNDQVIESIAQKVGLDMVAFKKDLASPKVRQLLGQDLQDANELKIGGTPSLFINGRKVKERSLATLQTMINQELNKSKRDKE